MATTAAATTLNPTSGLPVAYQSVPNQANGIPRHESLADLLAEIGIALDALPGARLGSAAGPVAAIATELIEQAELADDVQLPVADPAAPLAVSLRLLGVLAARTASLRVTVDGASAARARKLLLAV